jgi:hypothetical protein
MVCPVQSTNLQVTLVDRVAPDQCNCYSPVKQLKDNHETLFKIDLDRPEFLSYQVSSFTLTQSEMPPMLRTCSVHEGGPTLQETAALTSRTGGKRRRERRVKSEAAVENLWVQLGFRTAMVPKYYSSKISRQNYRNISI